MRNLFKIFAKKVLAKSQRMTTGAEEKAKIRQEICTLAKIQAHIDEQPRCAASPRPQHLEVAQRVIDRMR